MTWSATPGWVDSGATRYRIGWFGRVILEREQVRDVWRPGYRGYTPANWVEEVRWVPVKRGTTLPVTDAPPPEE